MCTPGSRWCTKTGLWYSFCCSVPWTDFLLCSLYNYCQYWEPFCLIITSKIWKNNLKSTYLVFILCTSSEDTNFGRLQICLRVLKVMFVWVISWGEKRAGKKKEVISKSTRWGSSCHHQSFFNENCIFSVNSTCWGIAAQRLYKLPVFPVTLWLYLASSLKPLMPFTHCYSSTKMPNFYFLPFPELTDFT